MYCYCPCDSEYVSLFLSLRLAHVGLGGYYFVPLFAIEAVERVSFSLEPGKFYEV